jgi:hypothetical protein
MNTRKSYLQRDPKKRENKNQASSRVMKVFYVLVFLPIE